MVVDSGDLLNEDEEIPESVQQAAKLKAETIVKILNKTGIDAANVGELDLVLGIDFLKDLAKKHNFPFVSANLVDENGQPIFKRYVVTQANGKNVGIFGVIGDTSEMATKVNEITKGAASVEDPLKAAESIIKELAGKVDYMVVLTHQGTNRDWVIARRVPGIDLVVGGHDKQKTKDPFEAEKTLIVQAGEKNQYQGMIQVAMDGTKKANNTLLPFGEEMPNDPAVKAMITEYNDKVAEIYGGGGGSKPATATVALRISACETCHPDQVKSWQTSAHAKAYDTLVKRSRQFDPQCLACHTTRFEQPDGFSMKAQQPELVNVQCESCHGFSNEHALDLKPVPLADPKIDFCIKCHTPDRCPTFDKDAAEVMEKIKHWD